MRIRTDSSIVRAPVAARRGQGLTLTRWKGLNLVVIKRFLWCKELQAL